MPGPTVQPPVVAALGRAPAACGTVTQFAYVGTSTLRELGLGAAVDPTDADMDRAGRFWVTSEPLDVGGDRMHALEQEAAARAARGAGYVAPLPAGAPARTAERLLCIEWVDGNPIGLVQVAVPDEWAPPSE